MLSLDDPKWKTLEGGYRIPYDPTSALKQLMAGQNLGEAWEELWNELHHQGDVGEASYASVPHLVAIHERSVTLDWNVYSLISTIEIQRHKRDNPPLPEWMANEYQDALNELSVIARDDLQNAEDDLTTRAILGFIALTKGLRIMGEVISYFEESELEELLNSSFGQE